MVGKQETKLGDIVIPTEVISDIVGMVTTRCYGVVGMASRNTKDGIASLLKREVARKGIKVTVEDGLIVIDLHVIVQYGVNISAICNNIIDDVKYSVESMLGFKVKKINIYVESVRV